MAKLKRDFVRIDNDFTIIPNEILKDKTMKPATKCVLLTMLSLPPEWDFSIQGITQCVYSSKEVVQKALVELEDMGYITRVRERKPNGTLGAMIYTVHQFPVGDEERTGKHSKNNQDVENLDVVFPKQAKQSLLNTSSNNIYNNTNNIKSNTTTKDNNKDLTNKESNNSYSSPKKTINSSSPSEKTENSSASAKQTTLSSAEEIIGLIENRTDNKIVIRSVEYYLRRYEHEMKHQHPRLIGKGIEKVVMELEYLVWYLSDYYEDKYEVVTQMIDRHFETNYGIEIDYNLVHFCSYKILQMQGRNIGVMESLIQERDER